MNKLTDKKIIALKLSKLFDSTIKAQSIFTNLTKEKKLTPEKQDKFSERLSGLIYERVNTMENNSIDYNNIEETEQLKIEIDLAITACEELTKEMEQMIG